MGYQGTTDEVVGARQWSRAGVRFMVNGPNEFRVTPVTGQQRTVSVSPGTALVCGVLITETTARTVSFEANTTATGRWDNLVLRVEWLGMGQSKVSLEVKVAPTGYTLNVGTVYEALLARVYIAPNAGQFNGSNVQSMTPHGGKGGPVHLVGGDGLTSSTLTWLDLPGGSEVITDHNGWRYRKATTGNTWELISSTNQPWSTWSPNLRSVVTGQSVILGTGGVQKGRYKVIKNMCFAEVEIRRGVAGSDFRYGDLVFDLPPGCTPVFPTSPSPEYLGIQWCTGHLLTLGDGMMDWRASIAVATGTSYATIWVPLSAADSRLRPWMSSSDSRVLPSTGVPYQGGNKFTEAEVFTALLRYAVRVD